MELSDLFVDVSTLPDGPSGLCQLATLTIYYGYVLYIAANMIGDGSELLLLVPSLAGIVGSCVLPILGAVPDGMIVLFSGMGPDAQNQLDVGVGALAGSTIMLITLPWLLAVYAGGVDIVNGECKYTKEGRKANGPVVGIKNSKGVRTGGILMMITSISYLVLQVPATIYGSEGKTQAEVAASEQFYAGLGLFLTIALFTAYLIYQWDQAQSSGGSAVANKAYIDLVIKLIEEDNGFSLRLALFDEMQHYRSLIERDASRSGWSIKDTNYKTVTTVHSVVWERLPEAAKDRITEVITYFWLKFVQLEKGHGVRGSGKKAKIEMTVLRNFYLHMGDEVAAAHTGEVFKNMDTNHDGVIELDEFIKGTCQYLWDYERTELEGSLAQEEMKKITRTIVKSKSQEVSDSDDDDDADDEEMPEELQNLDPSEQQRQLLLMSFRTMGIGTLLVVLFSDPMTDVLSEIGTRTGIPAFYVSFVLAPVASNAAELLAAFKYASSKSEKTVGIALQQLQGAACMNNTFCLAIFMALIYYQGLAWEYFAETLSILICQIIVAMVSRQYVQTTTTAIFVASTYPLCLILVAWLESMGYD